MSECLHRSRYCWCALDAACQREAAPYREALDNLVEAATRINYDGEAGDVEDFDRARAEAADALSSFHSPTEDR